MYDENKAFHLIQTFELGEVSYEEAHAIGIQLAECLFQGKYSYVLTTHIARDTFIIILSFVLLITLNITIITIVKRAIIISVI